MALLMRAMRRQAIDAGTDAWLGKQALKRQRGRWASQGGTFGPPVGDPTGTATELRGLARLRDAGVISDEEFSARKRRVLGI
jgi:Short C-terminal domain